MRFGIIGCGVIAPTHGNAIKAVPGAEIAAVADVLPEAGKKFAAEFGVKEVLTDYRELLKRKDVDAVCICTPSGMHAEMAIQAARAGKHIVCEKPIDINKKAMDAMLAEVEKAGVKFTGIFQRRMGKNSRRIKAAIEAGEFGRMVLADAYLKYYRSQDYYRSASWRATWEMDGGGALMNQGVHGIDLVQWLMGGIKSVTARCATLARQIQVEDTAVILVEFKNGALGVIEGTTSVYPAQETRLELHGEKGSVILKESSILQWQLVGQEDRAAEFATEDKAGGSGDPKQIGFAGHIAIIEDLIDAVKTGRDPFITGDEARKAVDLILAIYESSRSGKTVTL